METLCDEIVKLASSSKNKDEIINKIDKLRYLLLAFDNQKALLKEQQAEWDNEKKLITNK